MKWADAPTCHVADYGARQITWRDPVIDRGTENTPPHIEPWRTCSYCGSIHPEDLLLLTQQVAFTDPYSRNTSDFTERMRLAHMDCADFKYGYPHKIYVHPNIIFEPETKFVSGTRIVDGKPQASHWSNGKSLWAKFYTVHLSDNGIDDEAFASIANALTKHVGVEFSRDERGVKWRRVP
jgi:hypothetical protein